MNARPWRILLDGPGDGARNMAVDGAILRSVEAGNSPPTLRIYGWNPPCVTLGHFQKPETELDAEALRERGWEFVIRPTGGRAVLHADEITYSLAVRRDEAPWCATLARSHARIGEAWAEALKEFTPRLSEGVSPEDLGPNAGPGWPCFASASRAELGHAGRKMAGSAQRRTRGALLQHGSIPLTPRHEHLVDVLRLKPEERDSYRDALRRHAISLGEIRDVPADVEAWSRRLAVDFCRALGVSATQQVVSPDEAEDARNLAEGHRALQREFFSRTETTAAGSHAGG